MYITPQLIILKTSFFIECTALLHLAQVVTVKNFFYTTWYKMHFLSSLHSIQVNLYEECDSTSTGFWLKNICLKRNTTHTRVGGGTKNADYNGAGVSLASMSWDHIFRPDYLRRYFWKKLLRDDCTL